MVLKLRDCLVKGQTKKEFQDTPMFSYFINPFPNTPFWISPNLRDAAEENCNMAIKGFSDIDCIENIVEKGEIAHFEQFHLFPQCFPKAFSSMC